MALVSPFTAKFLVKPGGIVSEYLKVGPKEGWDDGEEVVASLGWLVSQDFVKDPPFRVNSKEVKSDEIVEALRRVYSDAAESLNKTYRTAKSAAQHAGAAVFNMLELFRPGLSSFSPCVQTRLQSLVSYPFGSSPKSPLRFVIRTSPLEALPPFQAQANHESEPTVADSMAAALVDAVHIREEVQSPAGSAQNSPTGVASCTSSPRRNRDVGSATAGDRSPCLL